MKLRKNHKKGFTLIELIVVIAILGILAAILIPQFGNFRERAQENAVLAEARSVATAIDAYYALTGSYPALAAFDSVVGGDTADGAMVSGGYITGDLAQYVTVAAGGTNAGFTYARDGITVARVGTGAVEVQ